MTLPKMDPVWKRRWVEALRSGKYTQTRNQLRNSEGFCCLGVLQDIAAPESWRESDDRKSFFCTDSDMYNYFSIPSDDVLTATGLDNKILDRLTDYNDRSRRSFRWIASYIERYL